MNELLMHDVTNPPLAIRFFAYALLVGNEVLAAIDSACPALGDQLHMPLQVPPPPAHSYSHPLAWSFHLHPVLALTLTEAFRSNC